MHTQGRVALFLDVLSKVLTPALFESRRLLFSIFFLALSAITLTIWQGAVYFSGFEDAKRLQKEATLSQLYTLEQLAAQRLTSNVLPISVISRSPTLFHFASSPTSYSSDLRTIFRSLIESCPDIYQVRFIGRDGFEKLRIDKLESGVTYASPESLQDKSLRPYFVETMQLQRGELYLSSLNLNVEHGEVQELWLPTVRVSTPIFSQNHTVAGILIANVNAQPILNVYRDVQLQDGHKIYFAGERAVGC